MKGWAREMCLAVSGVTSLDVFSSRGGRSLVLDMNFSRLTASYQKMASRGPKFFQRERWPTCSVVSPRTLTSRRIEITRIHFRFCGNVVLGSPSLKRESLYLGILFKNGISLKACLRHRSSATSAMKVSLRTLAHNHLPFSRYNVYVYPSFIFYCVLVLNFLGSLWSVSSPI